MARWTVTPGMSGVRIHKVTGRQLLESQTLAEAGIKDGDVLRLQPEITAGGAV